MTARHVPTARAGEVIPSGLQVLPRRSGALHGERADEWARMRRRSRSSISQTHTQTVVVRGGSHARYVGEWASRVCRRQDAPGDRLRSRHTLTTRAHRCPLSPRTSRTTGMAVGLMRVACRRHHLPTCAGLGAEVAQRTLAWVDRQGRERQSRSTPRMPMSTHASMPMAAAWWSISTRARRTISGSGTFARGDACTRLTFTPGIDRLPGMDARRAGSRSTRT